MIKYNYKKRFTIDEIKNHPWLQGPTATQEEVAEELQKRKKEINAKLNSDPYSDGDSTVDSLYTEYNEAVKRSGGDAWSEDAGRERKIKIYDPANSKNTEFFSTFPPIVLLGALLNFSHEKKIKDKLSANSFKSTISVTSEQGNIVTFVVQILKVLPNGASKSHLVEGDESSDSEGLYEDMNDDEQKYD